LTSLYIHSLPGEEPLCRKAFEFARKLGVETIVSEPAPEAINVIERLADEFGINVAIHDHPKGSSRYWHPQDVLKVCEGRSPRLGACADVGH
jgi:sugar phosphate isomerase/epimerase